MITPSDVKHYQSEEEFQKRLVSLGLNGLRGKSFNEVMQRICDHLAQKNITDSIGVDDVFVMLWLLDRANGWRPKGPEVMA